MESFEGWPVLFAEVFMCWRTVGILAVLVGGVRMSALADGGEDDAKQLQGAWQTVGGKVGEKEAPATDSQLIFKGDKVTFKSGKEQNTATFTLDKSKNPRHINSLVDDGVAKGQVRLAIYELS